MRISLQMIFRNLFQQFGHHKWRKIINFIEQIYSLILVEMAIGDLKHRKYHRKINQSKWILIFTQHYQKEDLLLIMINICFKNFKQFHTKIINFVLEFIIIKNRKNNPCFILLLKIKWISLIIDDLGFYYKFRIFRYIISCNFNFKI